MELQTTAIISCCGLILFPIVFLLRLYIRRSYRAFCLREDQKDRISVLKRKIDSSKDYLRENYSTPLDHSIPDNIIPKTELFVKLISHKSPDEQERDLNQLLNILTETFIRLRNPYHDPQSIISPMNSLRDRLVREHMAYVSEHSDGIDF